MNTQTIALKRKKKAVKKLPEPNPQRMWKISEVAELAGKDPTYIHALVNADPPRIRHENVATAGMKRRSLRIPDDEARRVIDRAKKGLPI